jgi:sensor histidine kinase regulating citrate/malate metabolism
VNLFRHAGLKAKLIIPLVLTTISVGLISADQFGRSLKTAVFEEFSSKGVALAKSLASSAQDTILARDASTVQGFIDEYKGIRGVGFVYVLNNKGEVLAHTFTPAFPDNFNISVPHGKVSATISKQELIWQNRHFLDVEAPILAGTLGYAHVGMDIDIAQQMTADAIRRALLTSLLISALGLLFLYYILNLTIKQIVYLSSVSKKISEGAKLDLL